MQQQDLPSRPGFREQGLWVTLVSLVLAVIAFLCLSDGRRISSTGDIAPTQLMPLCSAIVLLVACLAIGHSLIAVEQRNRPLGERDRRIACTGRRVGSAVLACGVFAACCAAWLTRGNGVMVLVLLASAALAQAAMIGVQIVMLRLDRTST